MAISSDNCCHMSFVQGDKQRQPIDIDMPGWLVELALLSSCH